MAASPTCPYCTGLLAPRPSAEPWDQIIASTRKFVLAPSLGALVPGWLLVISRQHVLCAGALPAAEHAEMLELVECARTQVERAFGPATVFEHGPARPGTPAGCGVDHLHMHVVPLGFSLRAAATAITPRLTWQQLEGTPDLAAVHRSGIDYSLVKEPDRPAVWAPTPRGVNQFLRRAIAMQLGIPEQFDYRFNNCRSHVSETLARLPSWNGQPADKSEASHLRLAI